jgi:glycosyltransferase involved in cell wall biosynthesis
VIRHGYFDTGPECPETTGSAREKLGLPQDRLIYVFCGAFRHDKRIDSLVAALGDDSRQVAHHLVMVGDGLARASELHPDARLDFANVHWAGHLTFEELSLVVRAADGFVSAHGDEHLTSAGPHLSQSYRTSQVCLDSAYNREVLGDCAFYFEREPHLVESLRSRIRTVTREMLRDAGLRLGDNLDEYEWSTIARCTADLYKDIHHDRRS